MIKKKYYEIIKKKLVPISRLSEVLLNSFREISVLEI